MLTLIASDDQSLTARLRQALVQHGSECPITNIVSLDAAADAIAEMKSQPDVVVLVLDSSDERNRVVLEQIRVCFRGRIVAVGPREPTLILSAVHAGADDYVDDSGELFTELGESLNRSRHSANGDGAGNRLITLVGAAGGSGCSVLAANLSVLLTRAGEGSTLLDFDFCGGNAATLLNLKPRHTIADLCRNIDRFDLKMFEQALLQHESGVRVLAAPQSLEESNQVNIEGVEKALRHAMAGGPNVLVDLRDHARAEFSPLLQQSHAIVVVMRLDFASVRNARRMLEHLERIGVDAARIHLVINRHGQPKELPASQAVRALGAKTVHYVPDDPRTVNVSLNCGVPFVQEHPNSGVAKSLETFAAVLIGKPGLSTEAGEPMKAIAGLKIVHSKLATWAGPRWSMLGLKTQEVYLRLAGLWKHA